MHSANITQEQRKQVKDACLHVLSSLEDHILSTAETEGLIRQEFPEISKFMSTHLLGAVLFQIASTKNGPYKNIQNPSRGCYVFSKRILPRRDDVKTYQPHRGVVPKSKPAPKAAPKPIIVDTHAKPSVPSVIDKAPLFSFVGKINGQIIVKDDRDNLYVVQPAQLA